MHGHAWIFSEQVKANITDDSRCGVSDVAFRTAPPIGGFSFLPVILHMSRQTTDDVLTNLETPVQN